MAKILKLSFEVFGHVQGVSFRMYTQKQATALGVRGWCMNTSNDTVKGEIEGVPNAIHEMKNWLQHTGSPTSRIASARFSDAKELTDFSFPNFEVRYE